MNESIKWTIHQEITSEVEVGTDDNEEVSKQDISHRSPHFPSSASAAASHNLSLCRLLHQLLLDL